MQVSQHTLSPKIEKQIRQYLSTVLSELHGVQESQAFLKDFFTPTEQVVLVKRLAIAVALQQGKSYEEIKATYKVSSATISFVSEMVKKPGVQVALKKIAEDEWAEDIVKNFSRIFKKT